MRGFSILQRLTALCFLCSNKGFYYLNSPLLFHSFHNDYAKKIIESKPLTKQVGIYEKKSRFPLRKTSLSSSPLFCYWVKRSDHISRAAATYVATHVEFHARGSSCLCAQSWGLTDFVFFQSEDKGFAFKRDLIARTFL